MFEPFPLGLGGGRRSDRHGVTERHPTLALPRPFLDPRDIAAHGGCLHRRTRQRSRTREASGQTRTDCGAARLAYACQREPAHERALRRAFKLRSTLGAEGGIGDYVAKPKWMRWRTYDRAMARITGWRRSWRPIPLCCSIGPRRGSISKIVESRYVALMFSARARSESDEATNEHP